MINIAAHKQGISKAYNKYIKVKRFQVSDLFLRKAFQNTKDPKACKVAPKWEGPYLIDSEARKWEYWLATLEVSIFPKFRISIQLKAYFV